MREGAIDCGTNSVRLLIADVADGRLIDVSRRMEIVRLGEGVDRTGRLSDAAVERTRRALIGYAAEIAERTAGFHAPYHAALAAELRKTLIEVASWSDLASDEERDAFIVHLVNLSSTADIPQIVEHLNRRFDQARKAQQDSARQTAMRHEMMRMKTREETLRLQLRNNNLVPAA